MMAQILKLFVATVTIAVLLTCPTKVNGNRSGSEGNSTNCEELSAEELGQRYRKWVADERHLMASFPLHPALARRLLNSRMSESKTLRRAFMAGSRQCPKEINIKSKYSMDTSTCPWFLELTYDIQRYPMYLATARCKCDHCVGMHSLLLGNAETKCKALTVKEKVIRRKLSSSGEPVCVDGKADYENTWEDIAVGCTCVIRRKEAQERIVPRQ